MTEKSLKDLLIKHNVFSEDLFEDIIKLADLQLKPLNERKQEFIESLKPFVEIIGKDEANNFYNYWTALKPKSKKMAWEKEKSWNLEARLKTWMKNKNKFNIVNMLKSK